MASSVSEMQGVLVGEEVTPIDFEAFVHAHLPGLARLARLLADSRQDAEDLTQEALLRLFVKWNRVERADDAVAYARRVLVNCHLSRVRRRQVRVLRLDVHRHDRPQSDQGAPSDDRAVLQSALARLPARQRTAVVLRYYEDLRGNEIANLMGISESSVRSAISRATDTLRELLNPTEDRERSKNETVSERP